MIDYTTSLSKIDKNDLIENHDMRVGKWKKRQKEKEITLIFKILIN